MSSRYSLTLGLNNTYVNDSLSIEEPHDPWFRISGHATAESRNLSLANVLRFRFGNKTRFEPFSFRFDQIGRALPPWLHLADSFDTFHSLGKLGFVNNSRFPGCFDNSPGFVHAVSVGSTANVFPGIFRVYPTEVHGDVSEIVDGSETIFYEKKKKIVKFLQNMRKFAFSIKKHAT